VISLFPDLKEINIVLDSLNPDDLGDDGKSRQDGMDLYALGTLMERMQPFCLESSGDEGAGGCV
jgi:hypothetical protein